MKPHRIAENIDVFDFELTVAEVASIDELDTGVRGGPDPEAINMSTYPSGAAPKPTSLPWESR